MTSEAATSPVKVSVLGLGRMGSTLARTLAEAGCDVTVWNRTAAVAEALRPTGCRVGSTAAQAIAASPLTLVCVLDEDAVDEILGTPGVAEAMERTTIVNLTTQGVAAVRKHADLTSDAGAAYLGGGILAYPRAIGTAGAVILYSGDSERFTEHSDTLALLAGGQRFVGEGVADATVMYTACWTYYYGGLGGFFEAAAYAQSAAISIHELRALTNSMTAQLLDGVNDACERIAAEDFGGEQADVDGHVAGIPEFVADAEAAGVRATMLDAFVGHCRLAASAGDGGRDISTVVRALRRDVVAP